MLNKVNEIINDEYGNLIFKCNNGYSIKAIPKGAANSFDILVTGKNGNTVNISELATRQKVNYDLNENLIKRVSYQILLNIAREIQNVEIAK